MTTPQEKARVILDMSAAILLTKVQTDTEWAALLLREFAEALVEPPVSGPDQ